MANNLLLVVTGASRGLGRAIAVAFNQQPASYIKTILLARSMDGLEETRKLILSGKQDNTQNDVTLHTVDMGDLESLNQCIDNVFEDTTSTGNQSVFFDRMVFINNAGSLGKLGPCMESTSLEEMKMAVDLNVTSAMWTSVRFAQAANQWHGSLIGETTIVNISSLAAIQPLPTMGIYSAGKAARDMYHACLAKELEDGNRTFLKTLNYAPGPLETDMATELRAAENLDASLQENFRQKLVDPNESANVLVRLVLENSFTNGSHVDFFDVRGDP